MVTRGPLSGSPAGTVSTNATGTSLAITWATSPAAGSKVIVWVQFNGAVTGANTTVTDNGTTPSTFTLDKGALIGKGIWIFRADSITLPASGSYTVTFSTTLTAGTIDGGGAAYTGVATGGPTASNTSSGTGTAVSSGSANPAGSGLLYVAAFSDASGLNPETITFNSGATFTQQFLETNGSSFWPCAMADAITSGLQSASWTLGDSPAWGGAIVAYPPSGITHSGTATLSGTGTLTGTGVFAATAALSGSGTLSATGHDIHGTILSGSGTLMGAQRGTRNVAVTLSGSGTLTGTGFAAIFGAAALDGTGTLGMQVTLVTPAVLSGTGTLNLRSTGQAVFASAGAVTPQAYPGTSQVAVAPPGSSSWRYLGQIGNVTALKYSFACPGGCDKMSATVMVPAAYRTQLFNPGWKVRITRGGHQVWAGKLDEPVPSPQGWTLTAVGDGNRGADFTAVYTSTWPASQPDQSVSNAISRGLPWNNPGVGSPAGAWYGQAVDSGSQTIKTLLDLICTRGGLAWYVNSQPGGPPGSDLAVFPLPTAVNRLIVCTTPVPRSLGGDINAIQIRYQVTDASQAGSTATYALTSVKNQASCDLHGTTEAYIDLSSAGVMSAAAARAVGTNVLAIYQRASFAGPFTASYGQLLNAGGQPIDPGTDQAATVARLYLTDYGYGGEVTPQFPITFVVGAYEWDDFAQIATITPYQRLNQSLSSLLSMENTVLTPITVA